MIGKNSIAVKVLILLVTSVFIVGGIISDTQERPPTPVAEVPLLSPAQFQTQVSILTDLMKTQGINASFKYTEQQIQTNPSFAKDCHPLLHELGHAAYAYYGGYAKAIVYQNELCDSGYTHGVLESYLSSGPDITQALQSACTGETTTFNQWQCYHGLGHGVMLVSFEDIDRSTSLCNTLPSDFSRSACINGVFMQHFVVTDHDGSVPKTNPTSLHDCAIQPLDYKPACYNYAPSAYLTINNGQYASALKWCHTAEKNYVPDCIGGVGSQAMKENITNISKVTDVCTEAGKAYTDVCINGAVGMYVYFMGSSKQALQLCNDQFKAYQSVCEGTVALEKATLHV